MSSDVQRKLTTILAADAEGYSREMAADEMRTLGALRAARSVFTKLIARHRGRIANTAGDGLIAEFPSVVEAVQCAIEVQRELDGRPKQEALRFRIGIHLGDVIVDGDDLLGEGVNLAARLQAMADPGGILISQQVYDHVHAKLSVAFEYLGEKRPKNLPGDVAVYRLDLLGKSRGKASPEGKPRASRPPEPAVFAPDDLADRVVRHAKILGIVWGGLVVVDLATGPAFWAHWPGIVMVVYLCWKAAPLVVTNWFTRQYARLSVIVVTLVLINLATWTGYPWALWPAGALIVIELIRRLGAGSRSSP